MHFELSFWTLLGSLGIWCIEASYVPQIFRLWRLKDAEDISLFFPGLNVIGRTMAFAYAIHLGQAVLIVGFLAGMCLRSTLLVQVVWYRWLRARWQIRTRAALLPARAQ